MEHTLIWTVIECYYVKIVLLYTSLSLLKVRRAQTGPRRVHFMQQNRHGYMTRSRYLFEGSTIKVVWTTTDQGVTHPLSAVADPNHFHFQARG
jgi:hypothetical protein